MMAARSDVDLFESDANRAPVHHRWWAEAIVPETTDRRRRDAAAV